MMYEEMIQPILWVATVAGAIVLTGRALWIRRKGRRAKPLLIGAAGLIGAAAILVPAIGVVPAGYRGVVYEYSGGVNATERGEGIALLIPWFQHMRNTSVRTQKVYSDKVFSQSLDLQEITVVASVNYHVKPDQAAELYQEVGPDYASITIQPALFQRMKAAIGKVIAEDFALRRDKLALTVQAQLTSQLSSYGIVIEYVNIEDAIFDPAFVKAVKAKIIAEQRAQEETRLIEAEEAIKQQTIIKAQARAFSVKIEAVQQARANDLLNRSLTGDLLTWRWLNTWDGVLPKTLVGGSKDANLLLGIGAP